MKVRNWWVENWLWLICCTAIILMIVNTAFDIYRFDREIAHACKQIEDAGLTVDRERYYTTFCQNKGDGT